MFHVRWAQDALDELATLWMAASAEERQAITAATHSVEKRLSGNPHEEGESRPKGRRLTFVAPLALHFEVVEKVVTVLQVRLFRRRTN